MFLQLLHSLNIITILFMIFISPVLAVDSFKEVPRSTHPLRPSISVTGYSRPVFIDLDGDDNLDMIVGEGYQTEQLSQGEYNAEKVMLNYYRNIGTPSEPLFELFDFTITPFVLITDIISTAPAFVDIDADDDFDLALMVLPKGDSNVEIRFYENIGDAQSPWFLEHTEIENPFNLLDINISCKETCSYALAFADLDNDGDSDLLIGHDQNSGHYYENTGNARTPHFEIVAHPNGELFTPAEGSSLTSLIVKTPTFVDLDEDNDFDLFGGNAQGEIEFYKNIGNASQPNFEQQTNPLTERPDDSDFAPTFVDINADGKPDVVIGSLSGQIYYYENVGTLEKPTFESVPYINPAHPLGEVDIGSGSAPAWGDIDSDGDFDLLIGIGNQHGNVLFYENVGTVDVPEFVERTDLQLIENTFSASYIVPVLVDIDNDGDLDVFTGERLGMIRYFENVGTRYQPRFEERFETANPFFLSTNSSRTTAELGYFTALTFADLDNDGDLDTFIEEEERAGDRTNVIRYYENRGDVNKPNFVEKIGKNNPLYGNNLAAGGYWFTQNLASDIFSGAEGPQSKYVPVLIDIDNDSDKDIFFGSNEGTIYFYENMGSVEVPNFVRRDQGANPFAEIAIATGQGVSVPSFVDIDGDGDLDAFIGVEDGTLRFFENRGPANSSYFVERVGKANPLDGIITVTEDSIHEDNTPVLVDFDDDEDFDFLVLNTTAEPQIIYYENTGDATIPIFTERYAKTYPNKVMIYQPTVADLDGDHDLDIFHFGGLFLENEGEDDPNIFNFGGISSSYEENKEGDFIMHLGKENPLYEMGSGYVKLVDIDADGDLDVFVGTEDWDENNMKIVCAIKYHENGGTATSPVFKIQEEADPLVQEEINPLFKIHFEGEWCIPAFADIDNDEDIDVFIGGDDKIGVDYYENRGTATTPNFVARTGTDNFLGIVSLQDSSPILVDIDNDGDLDAFVSAKDGTIHFYENIGITDTLPRGGSFSHAQSVILRCLDCANIYYTLDGSEPSVTSTPYTTPISVTDNTTIKFITVDADGHAGSVQTQSYIIDTKAPTIKIFTPITNTTQKNIPEIRGTVLDSENGSKLDRIELEITDGKFYLTSDRDNPFSSKPSHLLIEPNENWFYNTSTVPFSQDAQYTITVRAFDAVDNVGQESVTVTIGDLAFTTLSLTLNSQTILQNDTLAVTGKLQRLPDIGVNLAGETLTLIVTAPEGVTTTHTTTTDSLGNYVFQAVDGFTQKGSYTLQTFFEGSGTLAPARSTTQSVLVGTFAGYAILVQGKIPNEEGLDAHNKTLNRVYRKLKDRGFVNENIRYFNYNSEQDSDQEGVNDVFAKPNKVDLQQSIETWLRDRTNSVSAPLYLIMIDHGSPNAFLIGDDTITPTELNDWLTTLESGLTTTALQEPRILILGACYSGSFMSTLSKTGRLVISSAAENEESYKGPMEEDGIRSGEFFIEEFFQQLGRGQSFKAAFEQATRRTEIFTRQGNLSANTANRFLDDAVQHPLLDDNGDSVGSNVLLAGGDGQWAESLFLGAGLDFNTNDPNTPAYIKTVTPTQYLAESETSTTLYLEANDARKVDPANLEIRPPSKQLKGTGGTEQLNIDLDAKFLQFNEISQHFEAVYDKFTEQGRYEIFYTVRDTDTKDLSLIKRSVVYKNRVGNQAPTNFQLRSPANGAEVQTVLILDWDNSTDPDQDSLSYTVTVAKDALFTQIIYQQEELPVSMAPLDEKTVGLQDLTPYFWRVQAIDNFGAQTSSEIFTFKTDNNVNAPPSLSSLNVVSALDFTALESATVTIDSIPTPPTIYEDQGRYDMLLPSGNYNATVQVPGFQPQMVVVDTQQGLNQQNIALLPTNDAILLPHLQGGMAITRENQFLPVNAQFKGGVAVNGGIYQADLIVNSADFVVIKGEITVDPAHIGQLVDIIVVASYTPAEGVSDQFFTLDVNGQVLPWNLEIGQLVAYQHTVSLAANQVVEMYSGRFAGTGQLRIYYGYRLAEGTVVFNGMQPIKVNVQ